MVNRFGRWPIGFAIFAIASVLALSLWAMLRTQDTITPSKNVYPQTAKQRVLAAWEAAQHQARFKFDTEIRQITSPAPKLSNVGRSPQTDYLFIEGETNQAEQQLQLTLWHNEGSLATRQDGLEIKVEDDLALARTSDGKWEEIENFSELFAPNNNPLSFLIAIKNVEEQTAADHTDSKYTHFTFDLDSLVYAQYMRDQLEAALRMRGELPAGINLDLNEHYRNMQATGEIWLDTYGTPLRLSLSLNFPAQDGKDQLTAHIKTDFRGFERESQPHSPVGVNELATIMPSLLSLADWQTIAGHALAIIIILGVFAIAIRNRRSRVLYVSAVGGVTLSMVVSPLFQAYQIHAFAERYNNVPSTQPAPTQINVKPPNLPEWNPSLSIDEQIDSLNQPLFRASQPRRFGTPFFGVTPPSAISGFPDTDGDGVTDDVEADYGSDPNNPDTDADTLTDGQEIYKLGTSPVISDTDSDGLTDPKEVAGFVVNNKRWYTDPSDADTNKDGLLDGIDCAGQSLIAVSETDCSDTDNDGTPDIFATDNDGDLVPDNVDLSPFTHRGLATPFDQNNPFSFNATALQPDKPLYVNLQLRPTDPEHLTYALNVLDWPANDTQGNIRRYLDTTFANTANASIRTTDANAAKGDMRLIPMISVQIPKQVGHFGNLPTKAGAPALTPTSTITDWVDALDTDKLNPYAMNILKADEDTLEILTPAILEADETGGGRVAFGAHLYYQTSADGSWGSDHKVRLLWMVQMIIDVCDDPAQEGEAYCDNPANRQDELTVLHVYDDSWYLTGMSLEEHRGVDVGILFENPVTDADLTLDNRLWHLGFGLAETFVNGVDDNADNQRDVTVAEIARRWQAGSTATATDRWQVPVGATDVVTFSYDHPDLVTQVAMTETNQLLNTHFLNGGNPVAPTPTLLYARERNARSVPLVTENQSTSFDFSGIPIDTVADLNWAPYHYDNGWKNHDIVDYTNQLRNRLELDAYFIPINQSSESLTEAETRITITLGLYLALYTGYANLVQQGSNIIVQPTGTSQQDLETQNNDTASGGIKQTYDRTAPGLRGTFTAIKGIIALNKNVPKASAFSYGGAAALVLFTSVLIVDHTTNADSGALTIAYGTVNAIGTAASVYTAVRIVQLSRAASSASQAADLINGVKVGKFGLIAGLIVTWGVYAYSVLGEGAEPDDPQLLANTTAMSVFLVALFIIGAISASVGAALVLFLLIFDGLAFLICGIAGKSGGLCGGLTSLIVGALASLFFEVDTFVDMSDRDRLKIDFIDPVVLFPEMGMIPQNTVQFTTGFTNALRPEKGFISPYGYLIKEGKMRSSTFVYDLSLHPQDIHSNVRLGQMPNAWTADYDLERYTYYQTLTENFALGAFGSGINVPYQVYLNEGYAVPYEECFKFIFKISCKTRTLDGTNSVNISEAVVYDVLPATIDGFYNLASDSTARYLRWTNDLTAFPNLVDADGDGLRARYIGGSDPDDGQWDTDGDGLNDKYEHEIGTNPVLRDTDGDTLDDSRELILGTNPHQRDTDFDGLEDAEELAGWEFVYDLDVNGNALTTWVRSDPLSADPDNDDILDNRERIFGFHPRVASEPIVLTYNAVVNTPYNSSDGLYAKSGDSVSYDANITNELFNRHAYGQLETRLDPGLSSIDPLLESFFLLPQEQISRSHNITIDNNVNSGPYRMRQAARATIADPRTATNGSVAYYSFDNPDRPLIDVSGSLPAYHGTCTTACPTADPAGKIGSAMQFDGVNDYVSVPEVSQNVAGTAFSIGAWVYPAVSPSTSNAAIFAFNTASGNDRNLVAYTTDNRFQYSDGTVLTSTAIYEPGNWYYVAISVDAGNNGVLYVDGVPQATFNTAIRPTVDGQFSIGQEWDGLVTSQHFEGSVDEVSLFDRAVQINEMAALMITPEPVYYLSLDNFIGGPNGTASFLDRSESNIVATCESNSPGCPSYDLITSWGLGAGGNSTGRIDIDGPDGSVRSPDLSHGEFTQSFWLNLSAAAYEYDNLMLVGYSNFGARFRGSPSVGYHGVNLEDGYDLERGAKIKVGFGDGIEWTDYETPDQVLSYDTWHHVAVTFSDGLYIIYVDGERVDDSGATFGDKKPVKNSGSSLSIRHVVNMVDELQIYQVALTPEQIQTLYGGGYDLITHVPFEDAPGSTTFENEASLGANGYCSSATCPTVSIPGREGFAAQFENSGTADQILIPYDEGNAPLHRLTMAAWVKGSGPILSRAGEGITQTGKVEFRPDQFEIHAYREYDDSTNMGTLSVPPAAVPSPTEWTHVAVTFSGYPGTTYFQPGIPYHHYRMHFYINGQEVAVDPEGPIGALISSTNPFRIGDGFDGIIDDVRLYGRDFSAEEILNLYKNSAPTLHLPLDEDFGATAFVNSAGTYPNATCTQCPQAGHKGQLGLATYFTSTTFIQAVGANDLAFGGAEPFSVGAWVRPETDSDKRTIVAKSYVSPTDTNDTRGYLLGLDDGFVRFWRGNGTASGDEIKSPQAIPLNVWSHVYAIYDGHAGRLYLNGQPVTQGISWTTQLTNTVTPLLIGAEPLSTGSPTDLFHGSIDHVSVYEAALSDADIERIYDNQVTWVEERSQFEITVDNDDPTTTIRSDTTYRANQPSILDIYALDITSPIAQVDLLVNGAAAQAPLCQDAQGGTAFCPTFTPTGEGTYTLQSRAIDTVGHVATSPIITVHVDATAPTVGLTTVLPNPLRATPHTTDLQRWYVSLSGTASDPNLGNGQPGSGITSLIITIFDAAGKIMGDGPQAINVNGGTWQLDYPFIDNPDGVYTIKAIVTDLVGNEQTITLDTATFDGLGPDVSLSTVVPDDAITETLTISGITTDTVAGVQRVDVAYIPTDLGSPQHNVLPLSEQVAYWPLDDDLAAPFARDISGQDHHLTCSACPTFTVQGHLGNAASFDGQDDHLITTTVVTALANSYTIAGWVYPEAGTIFAINASSGTSDHVVRYDAGSRRFVYNDSVIGNQTSSNVFEPETWIHVALIIDDTGSEILYINGQPEITFDSSQRISSGGHFSLGLEGSITSPTNRFQGLIDEVQVFSRALSAAEISTLYRGQDPILWLDFESNWVTDGFTITDQSGWSHQTSFQSSDMINKADVGIVGDHALHFDGDDYLPINALAKLAANSNLSMGGWLHPMNGSGQDYALAFNAASGTAQNLLGYDYDAQTFIYTDDTVGTVAIPGTHVPGQWYHLMLVLDEVNQGIIYLNGAPVVTTTISSRPDPNGKFSIGQAWDNASLSNFFHGSLDDLIIYPRTLAALEVQALYRQGWQPAQLGSSNGLTTWTTSVPEQMEGLFDIEVRATDAVENVSSRQAVWRGIIDNMAPRIVTQTTSAKGQGQALQSTITYVAKDFNLSRQGFSTSCGIGQIDTETDYETPWLLALNEEARGKSSQLFQAEARCSTSANLGHQNACDQYGNCIQAAAAIPNPPMVSINDVSVSEASGLISFTVSLSETYPYDIQIDYNTSDISALTTSDYTAIPTATLTIPSGQLTQTIAITINNDLLDETDETFNVTLSNPVNTIIDDGVGLGTITDDDATPTLGVVDAAVGEGDGTAIFTVTLSAVSGLSITVDYQTSDDSAIASLDYEAISSTLLIPAGVPTSTIAITITDDLIHELTEAFTITVNNPVNVMLPDDSIRGSILDNDPRPTLSMDDISVAEDIGNATLTATLSSVSGLDVTAAYRTTDHLAIAPNDYATTSGVFTISAGITQTTISVPIVDDRFDEATESFTMTLSSPSNATITNATTIIAINDDDTAGMTTTQTSNSTDVIEGGNHDNYTLALTSVPTSPVSVTITANDQLYLENSASTQTIVFSASLQALLPQTVTVEAVDDSFAEGTHTAPLTHTVVSADPNYANFPLAPITTTITDNDTIGILVSPISSMTTSEWGNNITFSIRLESRPTAAVTISLTSSNPDEALTSPSMINISPDAWFRPQVITVTGVDDLIDDQDQRYDILISPVSSADPDYGNLDPADILGLTNLDDDTLGISTTLSGTTSETGDAATLEIRLTSQPTTTVTLPITSTDLTEGQVSTTSLTFTATTWSITQTVFITGVDDALLDGNIDYSVLVGPANSSDAYHGFGPIIHPLANEDDEEALIQITQSDGTTSVAEGHYTDTITVVLGAVPLDVVTVTVVAQPNVTLQSSGNIFAPQVDLIFTPLTWEQSQTITIQAIDDATVEGDHFDALSYQTNSTDGYDGFTLPDTMVRIIDNDLAYTLAALQPLQTLEGDQDTLHYVITRTGAITTESSELTFVLSGTAISQTDYLIVDPMSQTLNFATGQLSETVQVSVVDDDLYEGDETLTVTLAQANGSGSASFENLTATTIINDDDTNALLVSNTDDNAILNEGEADYVYTLMLASMPTNPVTITITPTHPLDLGAGTGVPIMVVIDPLDWKNPLTITVTVADDNNDLGTQTLPITHTVHSLDPNYNGLTLPNVTITFNDNDGGTLFYFPVYFYQLDGGPIPVPSSTSTGIGNE